MRYFFLSLLMVFLTVPLAQAQDDEVMRENLQNFAKQGGILRTQSVTEFRGTPFFNEWTKGHVILGKNKVTQPITLRYDMEYDAVQFAQDEKIFAITNDKMEGFVIYTTDGNIKFKNGFNTDKDDITPNTLLRIIYDGNIKLVAHHTSTLQENMPTYGTANTVSEFVNDTNFFLVKDGIFHEVGLNDDDILEVLSDHREELRRFAEENNLNFSQEPELKKILGHYDQITSSANNQQ